MVEALRPTQTLLTGRSAEAVRMDYFINKTSQNAFEELSGVL